KNAISFFEKLEKKEKIDNEFVSDFSQFCIYVSNMRLTIQSAINTTNDLNKEGHDIPVIFKPEDIILLDRLLQVLYDNYRHLVEFDEFDKSENFLTSSKFFTAHNSLLNGDIDILKNDYEISVKF